MTIKSTRFSDMKNTCFIYKMIRKPFYLFRRDQITCYVCGSSSIADDGNIYLKCVSIVLDGNLADIRASVTLFTCYCFYITMSRKRIFFYQNWSLFIISFQRGSFKKLTFDDRKLSQKQISVSYSVNEYL